MTILLKTASFLGLALMLVHFGGCASSTNSAASTVSAPEVYLATLTVDADGAPLHAAPSVTSPVVATASSGERLLLLERVPGWLRVRSESGLAAGFIQPSALVSPTCTADRAEPRLLEEPIFRFSDHDPDGSVVVEAEFDATGQIIATRVVSSSLGDPRFEQTAIDDLRGLRFLPPTRDCKPLPFFYTFTREFGKPESP